MRQVQVAINGYGVIGKRVADAVKSQDDMTLADVVNDYRIKTAVQLGIPVYGATPEAVRSMGAAGIPVEGDLEALLDQADVVVDCTPKKIAATNKEVYDSKGLKSIFQGGEPHSLTGHSFVAQANYSSALGRDSTRVASCNTTSIVRTLRALKQAGLLKIARGTLIRRATDPLESHQGGIINTLVPEPHIPRRWHCGRIS